ncbi:MAG: hypothetical protein LBQ93_11815 [Treponema sp.]|nr:hypothetical protein [Treponema sp.]
MNKKKFFIALVLLSLFTVGTLFADEILQCRDPADGKITINFLGSSVAATYAGKSAQSFEVVILLKDGTTQYMTFDFPKINAEQTRRQNKNARGPIEKITRCDLTTSY